MGLSYNDLELESQAFDSYEFYYIFEKDAFWIRFKNFITYNENRVEGLDISQAEVDEIFSRIRIKGFDSIDLNKLSRDMIEVLGHADMYNFIFDTNDIPDIFSILKLNKIIFSHAPYSEDAGSTRKSNKFITGSSTKISNPDEIVSDLMDINTLFKDTIDKREDMSPSEYIYILSKVHHRITQIHPFEDGNGRSSRALFNWAIKLKGLPPFYIELGDKDRYYEVLDIADSENNLDYLSEFIINQIFKSSIRINKQDINQLTSDD